MNIKEIYGKYIDLSESKASGDEIRSRCPYHEDNSPSFSFNIVSGMYICFNPKCKLGSGDMAKFVSIIDGTSRTEALEKISKESSEPLPKRKRKTKSDKALSVTQTCIDQRVAGLMNHPDRIEALTKLTSWTRETMERFEIGYDAWEKRYWIPIKENGTLFNVRKYSPTDVNKLINVTGHGGVRLFPIDNLANSELIIMEGEKDCILANQHGFNAITVTGGAGTFRLEWKEHFIHKDIIICYDIDEAGKAGAEKLAQILIGVSRSMKIVDLPILEPYNGDYTDYIQQGHTPQDFRALIETASSIEPESSNPVDIPDTVYETTLDKVAENNLFYKRTKSHVRVISKDSSPAIIPRTITVKCSKDNGKSCHVCKLAEKLNFTSSINIDESTPEILQLIECTTRDRRSIIRDIFNIPPCKKFTLKETDHQAISRCAVIPSLDEVKNDNVTFNQKYVERDIFILGDMIEANMDYEIESIAMPDPKNQTLVHLGYGIKPADSSIEEFKMTPELKQRLEIFQCPSETR